MSAVRVATPGDVPALARVHVQAWRESYAGILSRAYLDALDPLEREARWAEWLALPLSTTHVAELDGEVVGFASAGAARDDAPPGYDAEIYAIYLLRRAQGRGLGRGLWTASREATGGRALVVWALAANPARAFYERLGGRVVGEKSTEVGGETHREVAFGWPAEP